MASPGGRLTPEDKAVWFINNLTLCDAYQGQRMRLRPWQEDIVRRLHTVRPDGLTKYRRALLLLPRKQAKTQLSACLATFHILGTGKTGQTVLCAASDRDQASHLFDKVRSIIEADPYLARQCKIYTSAKRIETTNGNKLRVLSSEGKRAHGENPSMVILDEVWTQPNRQLYEALTSGYAARDEYLTLLISTQGNRRDSLIYQEYEYAKKVRDGLIDNPEYLPIIYEASPESDWKDEKTWFDAMPALGDFASLEFIRSEFKLAEDIPSEESKVRQFYLNQLIAGEGKWLNRSKWDACGSHVVDPTSLEGRRCYGGADLSAKSDVTSVELVFPMDDGTYQVLSHFWIPEEYAKERDRKGYSTYQKWAEADHITLTKGFYIDEDAIIDKIVELSKRYKIKNLKFDDWSATRPATLLEGMGIKTQFMKQVHSKMNEPLKYLETLIATEKLHHGNHPVLNSHADNAAIDMDTSGNIRLDKQNSHDKIDGMVALTMAIAGAMVEKPKKESVYSTRGVLTL